MPECRAARARDNGFRRRTMAFSLQLAMSVVPLFLIVAQQSAGFDVRPLQRRQVRSDEVQRFRHYLSSSASAALAASFSSNDDDAAPPPYDPIVDWVPPPPNVVSRARSERIGPMKTLTSPAFFSTDERTGRRVRGLSGVPSPEKEEGEGRAVLFVSNHQLVGIDSWMVVSELIDERNIFPRSLVHPLVFTPGGGEAEDQQSETARLLPFLVENVLFNNPSIQEDDDDYSSLDFIETFGGVKVSPKNLYRLMETGQPALLFPGGARESFHGSSDIYTLNTWPNGSRTDFVRIAAKFNATIVPFSSIGAAESAFFLVDPPDRTKVPFGLGNAIANVMGDNVPFDARYDNGDVLTFPLVVPKPIPSRHLFLFHQPIRTDAVHHGDKESCKTIYDQVKAEIKQGIADLLRASKRDPFFDDSARRLVYERVWNKQAPTFPLGELNSSSR